MLDLGILRNIHVYTGWTALINWRLSRLESGTHFLQRLYDDSLSNNCIILSYHNLCSNTHNFNDVIVMADDSLVDDDSLPWDLVISSCVFPHLLLPSASDPKACSTASRGGE